MAELGPSGIHRMEMALARQKAVLQADCIGTSGWLLSVVDAVRLPEWIKRLGNSSISWNVCFWESKGTSMTSFNV